MIHRFRNVFVILATVILTLFWLDRDLYRSWVTDQLPPAIHAVGSYLPPPHAIWPDSNSSWRAPYDDEDMPSLSSVESYWKKRPSLYPDRALYAWLAMELDYNVAYYRINAVNQRILQCYVRFMKRGEKLDADNALYNLLQSRCLLASSIKYVSKPSGPHHSESNLVLQVVNRVQFNEAVRQFLLALKKPLRLYEHEHLEAAFNTLPAALVWEHYYSRTQTEEMKGRQLDRGMFSISEAAELLVQQGDRKTASKLLDIRAYMKMLFGDKQAPQSLQSTAIMFCEDTTNVLAAISHYKQGAPVFYGTMSDHIVPGYLPAEITYHANLNIAAWSNWDTVEVTIQQQAIWVGICLILTILILLSGGSQLVWRLIYRSRNEATLKVTWPHQPHRLAFGFSVAAMICTIGQIAAFHIWHDDTPGVWTMTKYIAPALMLVGWISMRFEFKNHCLRAAIPVPSRWREMVCNWLPVVFAAGCIMFLQSTEHSGLLKYELILQRTIAACFILAVIVAVTGFKLSNSVYYALANRETQRFMAWMVLYISIGVIPLQIIHEAILLQNDHTGLGAYKSTELLLRRDQTANRTFIRQVERTLKETEQRAAHPRPSVGSEY